MACKHCEVDSRKYCPQCGTILESAQNPARLCDNCGWFGDYTNLWKPCNIDQETFGYYTFTELGNWVHLLTKRAVRVLASQVKADLHNAQNYINIMQAKLDDIKKNL